MTIGPNKTYRTRDGRAVRIYAVYGGQPLPVHGATYDGVSLGWTIRQWDVNGQPSHMLMDKHALVEVTLADELRDQIPWDALRPEIRWVCMTSSGDWLGTDRKPRLIKYKGCGGESKQRWSTLRWSLAAIAMPSVDPARWRETLIERPEDT